METKPAMRTTEFYFTLAANVAGIVGMLAGALPPKYGIPAQLLANALYTVGRGLAKQGLAPGPR